MRAFNFCSPSSLPFYLIFRFSLVASVFIPQEGSNDDFLIFPTSTTEDGSPDGSSSMNFDSTLLSQSDGCPNDDATARKGQSKPDWCTQQERTQDQQQSSPPKGQQQDRSGWTDNKPYEGELPSQLQFLDEDPRSVAEPKPNKEFCGNRGIFAVCASDKNVGWWGQPDSMQFKLDPCTPCTLFPPPPPRLFIHSIGPGLGTILIQSTDSPGFPCLATEIIWCCQGIYMKAMEVRRTKLLFALAFF